MKYLALKIIPIATLSLILLSAALHYGSYGVLRAEQYLYDTYSRSKLGRYITALQSYEDTGTQVVQKADTDTIISSVSVLYGVQRPLIYALIQTESGGRQDAIAFNPELEKRYGKMRSAAHSLLQVQGIHAGTSLCPEARSWSDLYDPRTNIVCGTRILKYALDTQPTVRLALAYYNGGGACVKNGRILCPESEQHAQRTLAYLGELMYRR